MRTITSICLVLLCATADIAHAQDAPTAETFTVTAFGQSGVGSEGTMVYVSDGNFVFESTAGTMSGFFLETEDAVTGGTLRYAIYFDEQDQLHLVYAQTTSISLGILPLSLIYGVGFGANEFFVFGGYSLPLDLFGLPF